MPFRSQAQRRLFYAKMNRGEMSPDMVKKWEEHTPEGKLPERLHKKAEETMRSFWSGFAKRAEENYLPVNNLSEAPGAPEKLLKWNPHGGVDPSSPEDLQAAEAAGLVTLPPEVEGASCATCIHFRPITPELGHGFCTNPQIKQDVTAHMHCINWTHPGVHNPVEAAAEEAQQAQVQQAMMGQQGVPVPGPQDTGAGVAPEAAGGIPGQEQAAPVEQAGGAAPAPEMAQPSPVGTQSGFPAGQQTSANPLVDQAINDFQGQGAAAGPAGGDTGGAEPKPKKKKPSAKKDSKDSKGNTINIHVGKGSEKTSSQDFWKGIVDGY